MSLSVHVYVMVGVDASELVEAKKRTKTKTKYNEDTGEPYKVKEEWTEYRFKDEVLDGEPYYDFYEEIAKKMGLEAECNSSEQVCVIGKMVGELSLHGHHSDVHEPEYIVGLQKLVADSLKKAGLKEFVGRIRLWLLMSAG